MKGLVLFHYSACPYEIVLVDDPTSNIVHLSSVITSRFRRDIYENNKWLENYSILVPTSSMTMCSTLGRIRPLHIFLKPSHLFSFHPLTMHTKSICHIYNSSLSFFSFFCRTGPLTPLRHVPALSPVRLILFLSSPYHLRRSLPRSPVSSVLIFSFIPCHAY